MMWFRIGLAACFVAFACVATPNHARADDEPQGSKFVLDFSTVELESGVQLEREKSDLSLLINVILACGLDVSNGPADLSPDDWIFIRDECSAIETQWSSHAVRRWEAEVQVWMGSTSHLYLQDDENEDAVFVWEMLNQIGSRTGVRFEAAWLRSSEKLVFEFLSEEDKQWERERIEAGKATPHHRDLISPLLEGRGLACVSAFGLEAPGAIRKFVLFVDSARPRLDRQRCIADTVVRLMGLQVGYETQPAIGITVQRSPTPTYVIGVLPDGLRALELLYEDWLVPGMNVEQAVAAARENLDLQVVAD